MEQSFEKLEDGKIKWSYKKEKEDFKDKEFGEIGYSCNSGYVIFNSKDIALAVLERDLAEVESFVKQYEDELLKNEHSLDKFSDLKELIEKIANLHKDFNELNSDKIFGLYNKDPKKYTKLYQEFNAHKDFIKDELLILSKEYQKMQNYNVAKKNLDFNSEQLSKIKEQIEELKKL